MGDTLSTDSSGSIRGLVRLEGGPAQICGTVNLRDLGHALISQEKIKIRHLDGYEHYEPVVTVSALGESEASGESALSVFRWSGRTKIAE